MVAVTYERLTETTKPRAKRLICLTTLCSILTLFMLVFILAIFPLVFQDIVNSQVLMTNGTMSFEQWLAPTPAIYKIVTVYNLTNGDVVQGGGQPVLQALGPYYFREYREKVNVEEVYDRELRYGEKKWYKFDNETTNADLTNGSKPLDPVKDTFTTFNLAYIGVAYNLTLAGAAKSEIREAVIAAALENEQSLLMTRPVNDVVFGYKDKFLDILRIKMPSLPDTVQIVYNMSSRDITSTSRITNGRKNLSELAQYTEWQGYRTLPYWKSPEANAVNGTEGLFFAPNLDKTKPITTFVDDLFRSNPMTFVAEEVCKTINTYKYEIPLYVQQNASNNPLNDGFYAYGPDGLMNLTAAVLAPVFASKPSFLDAEEWLLKEVTGLPPANKTMDTNIWVEPYTGVLVKAIKQLQANMMIMNISDFPGLQKLREAPRYVPISLIVETGGMDDDLVNTFKNKVFKPKKDFSIALFVVLALCCIAAGVFLGLLIRHVVVNQRSENLMLPPSEAGSNSDLIS